MSTFTESTIEQAAINWLQELGYDYAFGPENAFDGGEAAGWCFPAEDDEGRSEGEIVNDEGRMRNDELGTVVRLRGGVLLSMIMMGEIRLKDVGIK